ncbi:MAG: hormogonium polysaccharide biosynthesis glycosyltransferase HpsO [Cyanobacteriota bacterium]|nr:hormogonium polysaccharide biosynthesis glycosyltransferase HpsO [Cyanobacteriota bacterium]
MRVLVASHTYIVDLNREKLRELAKLHPDIHVTIVVPRRWRPGGVQNKIIESEYLQEGSFQVVPVSNFSQNNQGLLAFGTDLLAVLRDFKPDIIQVEQGSKSLAYAQLITLNRLLGLNAKMVFFTWWNLPYSLKWPISTLEAYNLRHTDGIVVGNKDGADILRDRGYGGPIEIMPQLGVDENLFRPHRETELRQQLDLAPEDFVVGYVGRFVAEKGLRTLSQALESMTEYSWKWLLLGRGPLQEEIRTWAADRGWQDRIVWVESVPHDDVQRYINLLDVLVLPSETTYQFKTLTSVGWKEQFGHVLIEAMACRVPVIGSDSGEIPYVISEGGLVFPEGNVAALKACLVELIEQPNRAIEIAQRGYKRAIEQYTNKALAQKLLSFYKQLFGRGS